MPATNTGGVLASAGAGGAAASKAQRRASSSGVDHRASAADGGPCDSATLSSVIVTVVIDTSAHTAGVHVHRRTADDVVAIVIVRRQHSSDPVRYNRPQASHRVHNRASPSNMCRCVQISVCSGCMPPASVRQHAPRTGLGLLRAFQSCPNRSDWPLAECVRGALPLHYCRLLVGPAARSCSLLCVVRIAKRVFLC